MIAEPKVRKSLLAGMSRLMAPISEYERVVRDCSSEKKMLLPSGFNEDMNNMRSDWKRVGSQIYDAMKKVSLEQNKKEGKSVG